MLRVLAVGLVIAPAVLALVDMVQTRHGMPRVMPRFAWLLIILLVPFVGPVAWLLIGSPRRDTGPRPITPPPPPMAPDDDLEFLARLDRQRKDPDPSASEPPAPTWPRDDDPDEDTTRR